MKNGVSGSNVTGTPGRFKMRRGGWGWRILRNSKVVDGVIYRLHATRGWKKVGKVQE